jgi:hypothetical protein
MINNYKQQRWQRAEARNMDTEFTSEIMEGMNCSQFEATAILGKVYDVYAPLFDVSDALRPGQIRVSVIDAGVAPNVPLVSAKQRMVVLTLDAANEDLDTRREKGVIGLRRKRFVRICEEAFQQGGLLTVERVADLFNCAVRTLVSDLAALRKESITPPLRSTVKDMGRAITHRSLIIENWLNGMEYSDIAKKTYHSVNSVANYVEKFKRCVALGESGQDLKTTAFIARVSEPLAETLQKLYREAKPVAHRRQELADLAKKNSASYPGEKVTQL